MIGNAHLDPVWFWPWQEGYQEVKATFQSALDRMEENEGFIFTCAGADYYRWVEENEPAMFEKIRMRVQEGRWVIVGGMWIQPDMNAPCGESLSRQLLYSQRYFKERFGVTVSTGYNVDTFGHNAMTPQLLKKGGIAQYVWMRPDKHENPDIPSGPMLWEGADGTSLPAYRIGDSYAGFSNLSPRIDQHFAWADEQGFPAMCFYGVGNHGGGPTRKNLQEIEQYKAGHPRGNRVIYSSPDQYFAVLAQCKKPLPVWQGELQHHASGCYSTHSLSKQKHRQAENALQRMEKLGLLSRTLTGFQHKKPFVQQAWHNLLFNEFHDILGGCSAPDVMDNVVMQLDETLSIAAREENNALQRISWQVDTSKGLPPVRSKEGESFLWHTEELGTPVVVFNPHAFEATAPVRILRPIRAATDDHGNPVPAQLVRARRTNGTDKYDGIFLATVPPLGYRLYWVYLKEAEALPPSVSVSRTHLENDLIRAEFHPETGALQALIHKPSGLNVLEKGTSARLMDISHCDTWAHMVFAFDQDAGVFENAEVQVMESGPARASLRVRTYHGTSMLEQTYSLLPNSAQMDVQVQLNLHEKHRMVKLCFPTCFSDGKDVAEIPCGAIVRSANGNEEHCQRFVCMQGQTGGLALINDSKYSYSAKGGQLCLTAANTSIFADHYGQEHRDDSCLYMDQGMQMFHYALVPYPGMWQDQHLHQKAALLNQPMPHVAETYHQGALPGEYSGLSLSSPCIAVSALKRAENEQGSVLRLWETSGQPAQCEAALSLLQRKASLQFAPFEIKTLFIPDDPSLPIRETLITEPD